MAIKRELSCKNLLFVLGLAFFLYDVTIVVAHTSESSIFDVTKFDAKGNGKPEYTEDGENSNSLAFIQAWQKACNSIGPSKLVIPKGTFVVAQVLFAGPCQSHVTVELHGTILADPDPSVFPNQELIVFQQVEGATFTGTGAINVNQPPLAADPEKDFSIKFSNATSCVVDGIHSMNPSAFHLLVENSHNISIINTNFEATTVKPNTHSNAIYISGSSLVAVSNSRIKSGDDCITVSGGSSDISITGVTCVAGQGISVGAQLDGFHPDYNVKKPNYAKITNVHFKNIRGTTTSNTPLSFACNKAAPCDGIEVVDVFLNITSTIGKIANNILSASCANAKVVFSGKHDGLNCA
uniref:Uncharacterized protein n=1 Tax=Chenopodium quinoa TaxID=63459 RepID=A0A803LA13_CHEQI